MNKTELENQVQKILMEHDQFPSADPCFLEQVNVLWKQISQFANKRWCEGVDSAVRDEVMGGNINE